jgi:CRISPR-associated endonuclease/helicase Cas3
MARQQFKHIGNLGYCEYWGKADPDYPKEPKWHPLVYHCLDVAACGQELLARQPAWLRKLAAISNLTEEKLLPWLLFLLAIHDIGKFANGFQQKRDDLQFLLRGHKTNIGGDERHDTLGYVLGRQMLPAWLDCPELGQRGGLALRPWLASVTGHHGRPPKNEGSSAFILRDHFPSSIQDDAEQFVRDVAALFLPNGFPEAIAMCGVAKNAKRATWLLAGLAVAADWLGSNTRWFGYYEPSHDLEGYWNAVALPQARKAVLESGLVPASSVEFKNIHTLFPRIRTATPLQAWAEKTETDEGPQIFVIEELTGGGKTEAALTLAARLMAAGQGQGLYLALPTMATADAMFDRLRKEDDEDGLANWRRFFADGSGQLMLAHSADRLKLKLEEKNRRDAGYPKGEELSASRHCSTWLADSRKKALLADFGIGTIDQAFLAVLPVRHQSLRLLGLASKVLIVDEVHACDCYMGELLARLLSFHAALGGSAILLSATLPESHRARYLKAFAEGVGFAPPEPASRSYPLTCQWSATRWEEKHHTARKESARAVAVQVLGDEAEVFARLKQTLAEGRCAVWIRNSVADAVETWRQWQRENLEYPATLFHARFALKDRLDIGAKVLQAFGPDSASETRNRKLVIATQVIEQSLDADFDDMVTDLAPIDSIIQRAGRLQRHCRDANGSRLHENDAVDGRGGARLGVLMPEPAADADKGWIGAVLPKTGKVYPDHGKLWLTADWLKENQGFKLPEQARNMIESVYSDDLDTYERIPEALREISDMADGACRAGKSTARGNLLVVSEGYSPTSEKWQEDAKTPTRISEVETVRVRLARKTLDEILPWAGNDTSLDWYLSDLNVPDYLVAKEYPGHEAELNLLRETMPDEGRYVVLVILEEAASPIGGESFWRGCALNKNGEETHVLYSSTMGLTIDTGADDESDE